MSKKKLANGTRILLGGAASLILLLMHLLWRISGCEEDTWSCALPEAFEYPTVLAPLITAAVSTWVYTDIIHNGGCEKASKYSWSGMVTTFFCCLFLTYSHFWAAHLTFMILIFLVFVIWDWAIINRSDVEQEYKTEIELGNKYINEPTFWALFIISIGLAWVYWEDMWGHINLVDGQHGFDHPVGAFVAGVVAFHLLVSAVSYALVSKSEN